MDKNEGEFTLPSIPYFYHDIVGRIIPGVFQLGLVAVLLTHDLQSTAWIQRLHLKGMANVSQLAALLMLLAAAYFIGVFFEGLTFLIGRGGRRVFKWYHPPYHRAFKSALEGIPKKTSLTDTVTYEQAEETLSILETYEPLAPHFFARTVRCAAEAKMVWFSALAMPLAVVVVGVATGHWWPPSGWKGIISGVVLFILFGRVSFARQRRRAVEILRCVQYLAGRTEVDDKEVVDAKNRAERAWEKLALPAELPRQKTIMSAHKVP